MQESNDASSRFEKPLLNMVVTTDPAEDKIISSSVTPQETSAVSCCGRKLKKETLLVILTIIGVILGIFIGTLLQLANLSKDAITLVTFPGEILMRMLKMMIIPIIFTSIITSLANLDIKKSSRMGLHAVIYYFVTTTLAVILGIMLVCIMQPGNHLPVTDENQKEQKIVSTFDTFLDLIRNLFPDNIISACFQVAQTKITELPADANQSLLNNSSQRMQNNTNSTQVEKTYSKTVERFASTNVLGIISFSIFFGFILSKIGNEGKPVTDFLTALNKIFMKMIIAIIWYSPAGICSLIAGNLLKMGSISELMTTLGWYMLTVIIGLVIHGVVVLPLIYFVVTRKNAFKLLTGVFQACLTGFGTASSAGTLPLTMQCLEKNLNIDIRVINFVVPLGATMNMDGTALLEGVASITIAQMYGLNLTFGQIVTISVTATLASVGAAAIPSAGLVTLLLVLSAIGVPSEAVGILWSIDWFLDRLRTALNIFGDCVGAAIIHHLHKDNLEEPKRPKARVQEENHNKICDQVEGSAVADSGLVITDAVYSSQDL